MDAYMDGLKAIAPELILTTFAMIALVVDLFVKGRDSRTIGYLTLVGLGTTALVLSGQIGEETQTVFKMVTVDSFSRFFKFFTLAALAIVTVFVMGDKRERQRGVGEYYVLLMGAAIGIFFMVSTTNLLLIVMGVELLSLASYSLAGFHKSDRRSGEAALKYVIFGGLSAGVMVFGMSLLYGMTGSIDIAQMGILTGDGGIAQQITDGSSPGLAVAVTMILAGFAYKISAVPFHFWTPDVYQGAPTPVTTFLAVASKAAGFGVLLRFVGVIFLSDGTLESVKDFGVGVGSLLALLAAITMTVGNLSALKQTSLKRLLAYSSVAHAGYILMGIAVMSRGGFQASMYYLAAYYFMNLGAFGVVLYFEGVTGSDHIDKLRGLGYRAPAASIAMVAFLVSLVGLPPTVGFYGKYLLIEACLPVGLGWLALIALLNSAVSLFYYFRIAKRLFLSDASEVSVAPRPALVSLLVVLGILTIGLCLYTKPLTEWARLSMDLF